MSKKRVVVVAATALTAAGLAATGGYWAGHDAEERSAEAAMGAPGIVNCHENVTPDDPLHVMGDNWPALRVCPLYATGLRSVNGYTAATDPGPALGLAASDIDRAQRDIAKIVETRGLSDPDGARRDIATIRTRLDRQLQAAAHDAVGVQVAHTPAAEASSQPVLPLPRIVAGTPGTPAK